MKSKLIFLFALLAKITLAQIPNGGFETWTSQGTYNTPDSWGNLNEKTASASVYTCIKGTPGTLGASYIKLISKTVTGWGVVPGVATCGVLDTATYKAVSGFPYTGSPVSLKGKWQHMAYNSDEGYVAVYLTKWNTANSSRDTVASAVRNLGAMVMSWSAFTINLNYTSTATPDSAMIVLSASGANGVAASNNSYLYVDELSFFGSVGIDDVDQTANELLIAPNPSTGFVNVIYMLKKEKDVTVSVFDITGKKVKELNNIQSVAGKNSLQIPTADLSKGVYFMTMKLDNELKTEKIIIQ